MNIVLLLDWQRFNISSQVSSANARMGEMTKMLGLGDMMVFNIASMGAGELMTRFAWIKKGEEESPEQRKTSGAVLDTIRRFHWRVKTEFQNHQVVRTNHETREMIIGLRKGGHGLKVVWDGAAEGIARDLIDARALDYFEEQIGPELDYRQAEELQTLDGRLGQAINDPSKTLIVADSGEMVERAKKAHVRAVVGYVPSAQQFDEKGRQLKELTGAGADFAVIGGSTVGCIPGRLETRSIMNKIIAGAPFIH